MSPADPILQLTDVETHFPVTRGLIFPRPVGTLKAVDGVSLTLHRGEALGLVGESGCGKSTLARTILQLVPATAGSVVLEGRPLPGANRAERRRMCRTMQLVFQDPFSSLNPRLTAGEAIAEPLRVHGLAPRSEVPRRVAELLERVGLPAALQHHYPHEFSGGQRQRLAIARALALQPQVLIADEPVSALDVSIQAQIVNLLAALVRERQLSLVFIAHDLAVVKHLCDRVAVMYLGRIVELGPAAAVIEHPRHPYTQALVEAIPVPDPERARRPRVLLPGEAPSPLDPPAGCAFHPRCRFAADICRGAVPALVPQSDGRQVACLRLDAIPANG